MAVRGLDPRAKGEIEMIGLGEEKELMVAFSGKDGGRIRWRFRRGN